MILGIGNDLCSIDRIRRSLNRFGDAYLERIFTSDERRICAAASDPARYFARCFCGKEAGAKAIGTGMADGVGWRDIEVLQFDPKATLGLTKGALDRLQKLMPIGFVPTFHITCSDDRHVAQAFVIISAVPRI
ncbi:holo-ACP synthase [Mesorhizobium sp. M0955]|uniref:holo-ACP synthase n=1 Tax=unclassified Mesorhizobium TaxID=325217 RepID=UPI0033362D96